MFWRHKPHIWITCQQTVSQGFGVTGVYSPSNTPKSFVNACELFVYTEILSPQTESTSLAPDTASSEWVDTATRAVEMATQDDGWAFLGAVGNYLRQLDPAFDSRSYGHKQLSALIRSEPTLFKTRESKTKSGPSIIHVTRIS